MRGLSKWYSLALLASLGLLFAACGGGSDGSAASAAVKEKVSARKLALIDISVADFDGVALNEIIKFEFTERLQPDSVRPDTVQIREGPNFGKQVRGDFRVDGDVIWFYPSLPTKPAIVSTPGEVLYAGLKPGTLYQITLPGVPKVAVLRNFQDDPLRKLYRERFQTAVAGSPTLYVDNFLDPLPARIRFCNPPNNSVGVDTNTDIILTFNRRPLNPATVTRSTVKLTMLERRGEQNVRSIPGEPVIDQSMDRVIVRFVPDFPLADDAKYRITAERIEDLVGNDVAYFQATFTVRNEDWRTSEFVLTFNEAQKNAYMDNVMTTASWNVAITDALAALFTVAGGTGMSGDLMPKSGVNAQYDASNTPGITVETDALGVTYDVFNFRRINIPQNTTIRFAQRPGGPNRSVKVLSLFPIIIDGTITVAGGSGGNGEDTYSTSYLPNNPGGTAGPGGGNGAKAYDGTYMPYYSNSKYYYEYPPVDGDSVANGGDGGKGGVGPVSSGSNGYYHMFGGGGGGGGSKLNGQPGQDGKHYSSYPWHGYGGAGGLGRNINLARDPGGVGGAGGGAGGPMTYYYSNGYRTGAGSGGGGGGHITLQSGASITINGSGRILASGGIGGGTGNYYYTSGAGGGGGGGSIRLASTSTINVASGATLTVTGGAGGPFRGQSTYYAGGYGGAGGEGFLAVGVPDRAQATVSNTANLTYTPPYYDTTFSPVGGGAPSYGQTTWINLGVYDPEMLAHNPYEDLVATPFDAVIKFRVQMCDEDQFNLGNPDLSAFDLNDQDGDGQTDDTMDPTVMSDWVDISQMHTLNGNGYQFFRVQISFQLGPNQKYTDPLPFVDRLTLKFRY